MARVKLNAQPRFGTSGSYKHELRDHGKIPGIVYGKNMPNKLIEVDLRNIESILKTGAGRNSIIDLTVEESKPNKVTVMIKDLQRDPVKGEIIHADLQKINLKEKLHTTVPIHYIGHSEGVKKGGILQAGVRELEIECVPADVPEHINVDISALDLGDSLTAGDIKPDGNYIITSDPASVIVSIVTPRMAETPDEVVAEPDRAEKAAPQGGNPDTVA